MSVNWIGNTKGSNDIKRQSGFCYQSSNWEGKPTFLNSLSPFTAQLPQHSSSILRQRGCAPRRTLCPMTGAEDMSKTIRLCPREFDTQCFIRVRLFNGNSTIIWRVFKLRKIGKSKIRKWFEGMQPSFKCFFLPSSTIKHIMINNAVLVDDYFKNYIPMGIPLISTYGNPIPNLCNAVRGRFWTLLILTSVFARQACVLLSWHDMEIQCSFPENDLQTVVKLFLPYHVNGQELFGVVHLSSR